MRLFLAEQIRTIDSRTLEEENINSTELMQRAGTRCADEIRARFADTKTAFLIFVGPGNNGGDGVVVALNLIEAGYDVKVYVTSERSSFSPDLSHFFELLARDHPDTIITDVDWGTIPKESICIDALFGSGLNRPLEGKFQSIVTRINSLDNTVISIDIPSGMPSDLTDEPHVFKNIVSTDLTLSLQFPKLSQLTRDLGNNSGEIKIIDIGLSSNVMDSLESRYSFTDQNSISLKKRPIFSHKGTFGHLLVIAGSKGMSGAAYLTANAAMRSGCGLVTVYSDASTTQSLQANSPEIMVTDELPKLDKFDAMVIGPGIADRVSAAVLFELLTAARQSHKPVLLDADALNLLSKNKEMISSSLFEGSVITPHTKEFDRLFGASINHAQQIKRAEEKANELKAVICLKSAYTATIDTNYTLFNSSGNPGMATAGSGDVLSGIIGSLLAQGYRAKDAAAFGTYIHGLSGDIANQELGQEGIIARDLISYLPRAFKQLRKK